MGVRRYGIFLLVFNSISQRYRREIPHLQMQATMYYFIYYINTVFRYYTDKNVDSQLITVRINSKRLDVNRADPVPFGLVRFRVNVAPGYNRSFVSERFQK